MALLVSIFGTTAHADNSAGELLIGGLNCTACHYAPDSVAERTCAGKAPKLSASGAATTPQWISAFLDNPQKMKPGTAMPDMLGNLAGGERAEAVEALTQYLISLNSNSAAVVEAVTDEIMRGSELFHRVGCVACHTPSAPPAGRTLDDATKAEMAKLAAQSVPFVNLEMKYSVTDLTDFLRSPVKAHPAGTMPSFRLDEDEARRIAMYVLRAQAPPELQKNPGLKCEYFEKELENYYSFAKATPTAHSIADAISTEPSLRNEYFSLRFRGTITVPRDGEYTFSTRSDDGSWLAINHKLVVNNGGAHAAEERSGKVKLTAGDHEIVCCYEQGSSEFSITAYWEGPDLPKQEIPASALSHRDREMKPVGAFEFVADEQKVARGKQLFTSLNCAVCHPLIGESGVMSVRALADLAGRDGGCLSTAPAGGLPRFTIPDSGRTAIKAALADAAALTKPLTPAAQVTRTMTAMNCYACHSRAGQGGPQGFRRDYFVTNDGANTDDAKRLPPSLDDIGSKHDEDWITHALEEPGTSERATRMPVSGDAVRRLPESLIKADKR